jgi:hypothetical protein
MSVITGRQAIAQNALLPVAGLLALGLFILLYAIDKPLYLHLIGLWFPRVSRFPFMDADIGAQIGCWQRGVDVYAADPCDLLQRPFGYSPFWLRMWFLPSNLAWNNVLGIAQAAIFALSLAVLPKTPGRMPTVVMLLALLSPVTVFGVERSNPDLFMFVLAGLMVLCLERGMALRLCGYGAAALGGALKFYPVVLLLLVARERARTCLILAAIGLAAIVTFFLAYRTELVRMMPNLPRPAPFEYSLGATQLGEGLGLVTGHSWLGTWLFVILLSCCATGSIRLALRQDFSSALDQLTARQTACLLVGADLMVGCFFAGVSAGYRAIHLLFVLPGLLALARTATKPWLIRLFRATIMVALLVMWIRIPMALTGIEHPPSWQGSIPLYVGFWTLREIAWWFLITVLMAFLVRVVLQAPIWQSLFAWPGRRTYASS